jgi:hypothetical protein
MSTVEAEQLLAKYGIVRAPKRRPVWLSILMWTGIVMLLMMLWPFYMAALFLRTFVRI